MTDAAAKASGSHPSLFLVAILKSLAIARAQIGERLFAERHIAAAIASDLSAAQLDDARREFLHQQLVVSRDENGRAHLVNFAEERHDFARRLRVEVSGRLVGQEQRGLADDRARDGDSLLLSTR